MAVSRLHIGLCVGTHMRQAWDELGWHIELRDCHQSVDVDAVAHAAVNVTVCLLRLHRVSAEATSMERGRDNSWPSTRMLLDDALICNAAASVTPPIDTTT
eukprot:gb/GFBE01062644.1/.p1 GENE.gb/GFBE01062644.1/~~gb/GFBE01062644.1/.p1  ORF type:complete len:101 (+),score=13.28 gb/GFBE01062644.1/:1-303(+)